MSYFTWWEDAIKRGVVQKSQINISIETVDQIADNHEVLFYVTHEGYGDLYNYKGLDKAAFEEWFFDNFMIMKVPSGERGRPGVSMLKIYTMFVSSKTGAQKIEYIKDTLNDLYSSESGLQTNACLDQFSLPVTNEAMQSDAVKGDRFLSAVTPFVDGATTWPTHPYFPYYLMAHNKVVQKMIVDGISAEAAYDMLREELTYNVETDMLILEE